MSAKGIKSERKIKTAADLEQLWNAYKKQCDENKAITHEFSQKLGEFVSVYLNKPITYTIEGFCAFVGISRDAFYSNYAAKDPWAGKVTRMRLDCEIDTRRKFETGNIPTQLAGLWMSRYGYGQIEAEAHAADIVDEWIAGVQEDE